MKLRFETERVEKLFFFSHLLCFLSSFNNVERSVFVKEASFDFFFGGCVGKCCKNE